MRNVKIAFFDAKPYDKQSFDRANEQLGYDSIYLETLCARSDAIRLHSPLTPETRYLINERRLSLMKPGALIINTGRGALIDTKALVNALKRGGAGAAGGAGATACGKEKSGRCR